MMTEVKERPILFSGPMVRAILEGRKTQTRRIVKDLVFDPEHDLPCMITEDGPLAFPERFYDGSIKCPHGSIGERLWVRESFTPCEGPGHHCKISDATYVCYRDGAQKHVSSGEITPWRLPNPPDWSKQKSNPFSPSIHMPRWASRIDLEIVGLRVERLNQISPDDAVSEGIESFAAEHKLTGYWTTAFSRLWSTIHAADGPNGWDANPWVWVVEFRKV